MTYPKGMTEQDKAIWESFECDIKSARDGLMDAIKYGCSRESRKFWYNQIENAVERREAFRRKIYSAI